MKSVTQVVGTLFQVIEFNYTTLFVFVSLISHRIRSSLAGS